MKISNHRLNCKQIESPNQSGSVVNPTLLVLHYTASGANRDGDEKYFQKSSAKASAHLVIERDGEVTQCVPFNKKAWHAGKSIWRGTPNCNAYSIGIEIDNWGYLTKNEKGQYLSHTGTVVPASNVISANNKRGNHGYWEIYPQCQLNAVELAINAILERYPTIKEIVGHEDISPGRKIDPGPALYNFVQQMNNKLQGGRRDENPEREFRRVNVNSLRVRAGPSTSHGVVGSLELNQTVEVLYDGGDWCRIKLGVGEAWVYDKYLT